MIVVGSTIPAWKMDEAGYWASWLLNAEQIAASHPDLLEVRFIAVLELDARGREPFAPLLARIADLRGIVWTFSLDDGAMVITGSNRLVRICTGRNLISQYARDHHATHVLFADADTMIPGDAIPKLLELDWPIVGGEVPTYALHLGPQGPVEGYPFPVVQRNNTAGFLLVASELFRRLSWRVDVAAGMTDDPCYAADAIAAGYPTRVRCDVVGAHWPPSIGPVEQRGHDLVVRR